MPTPSSLRISAKSRYNNGSFINGRAVENENKTNRTTWLQPMLVQRRRAKTFLIKYVHRHTFNKQVQSIFISELILRPASWAQLRRRQSANNSGMGVQRDANGPSWTYHYVTSHERNK